MWGTRSGTVVTAVLFTLAHGVTVATPFHLTLGMLLGFLRVRSGSLYPGMVLHFVYNTLVVLLALKGTGS
ncbi:MAG: CPBP family intramembrane glutamic endopeptidase [Planctomycetota bacterium]